MSEERARLMEALVRLAVQAAQRDAEAASRFLGRLYAVPDGYAVRGDDGTFTLDAHGVLLYQQVSAEVSLVYTLGGVYDTEG